MYNVNSINQSSINSTLDAVNSVIELENISKSEKCINLYSQLFTLFNSSPNNTVLFYLWIEHLTLSLQNLFTTIKECEKFLENHRNVKIDSINVDNIDIEKIYNITIMKRLGII